MSSGSRTSSASTLRRRPGAVAIRHGDRALTYAELDERSNRLAQALLAAACGPGSRVASPGSQRAGGGRAARRREQDRRRRRAAQLAAGGAGADQRSSTDAGAPLLIAGPAFERHRRRRRRRACRSARDRRGRRRLRARGWRRSTRVDPGGRGEAGDPVVQMYTSGTTGVPKGVLTTQRNLAAATLNVPRWRFDEASVSLTPLPMFHIGGIGWTFLGLSQGATTILVREFDAGSGARPARGRARDERRLRADDPADADRGPGRGRARLLRAALDRLRRVADHDAGAEGGAAHVPLPAVRRLRAHRDDGRRRPARPRGPRPRRPARAPPALRRTAAAVGGAADRRPGRAGASSAPARSARSGCAART